MTTVPRQPGGDGDVAAPPPGHLLRRGATSSVLRDTEGRVDHDLLPALQAHCGGVTLIADVRRAFERPVRGAPATAHRQVPRVPGSDDVRVVIPLDNREHVVVIALQRKVVELHSKAAGLPVADAGLLDLHCGRRSMSEVVLIRQNGHSNNCGTHHKRAHQ